MTAPTADDTTHLSAFSGHVVLVGAGQMGGAL
ncbi:MAG: hypothetical protein FD152_2163, partial [Xanthobacteraceae bacterium]